MQHVARRAAAAHLGDLLAGLHQLAFVDQPRAVVAVGREPLVVVLDDHQFAIADQSRARIHHHAIGGGAHGLAGLAGDVDALPGRVAGGEAAEDIAVGGPAPAQRARGRRRCDGRGGFRRGLGGGRRRRRPRWLHRATGVQAQALPGVDRVRRRDVVPQRQVERGDAVLGGDPVHGLATLDHRGRAVLGLRHLHRALAAHSAAARFAHHVAAPAGGKEDEQAASGGEARRAHAPHHAPWPRNSNQPMPAASSTSTPQPMCSIQRCSARSARSPPRRIAAATR